MLRKSMRPDIYRAMRAGLVTNGGYIYRGRDVKDRDGGPQAGVGTLLMLRRRGWVRLVRADIVRRDGRVHREIVGAWIIGHGRAALRNEISRLGHLLPARLALRPAPLPPAATCLVDPFALIASAGRPEPALPF